MPVVRGWYNPDTFHEVDNLREVCKELAPAAFDSNDGKLWPGDLFWFMTPKGRHDAMDVDVFLDIEVSFRQGRANIQERGEALKVALNKLFPSVTFAIWPKLVNAKWVSDIPAPELGVCADMSMEAAVERAEFWLTEIRTTS
jgi:hypothetical protein